MTDFTSIFTTFAALVAATPVVTQGIKKLINKELPSWANQLISWITGLVLCMFGWFFSLGVLSDMSWWQALILGIGTSLASNGVFDIEFVKWILNLIFSKIGGSTTIVTNSSDKK